MRTVKDNNFVVDEGLVTFPDVEISQIDEGNSESFGLWLQGEIQQNSQGSEPQSSSISTQPSELNQTAHSRRFPLSKKRGSNIDFKKTFSPFRTYRRINKLPKNPYEKTHYGNKSYFFLTIQYFEKKGYSLKKLFEFYSKQAKELQRCEQGNDDLSRSVKEYYSIAINAFRLYLKGSKLQAFKMFYKYQKMRLRHNFDKAYEFFKSESKRKF